LENFAFTYQNVLFLSIHTLWTRNIKNVSDWKRIENDNAQWTRNQLQQWIDKVGAVVIFAHSYPRKSLYPTYWEELSSAAEKYPDIPFLFIQGDAHRWTQDTPFRATNILRVVVDRGGIADPVLVTVNGNVGTDQPFVFEQRPLSGM
jgi:hypothetical protein